MRLNVCARRLALLFSLVGVGCAAGPRGDTSPAALASARRSPVIAPELRGAAAGAAGSLKVWVYFMDKGVADDTAFQAALGRERAGLTPRCAWRRAKTMGGDLVTFEDLPAYAAYLQGVSVLGARPRQVSRWLNAASVAIAPERLDALAALPFVRAIDPVRGGQRRAVPRPATWGTSTPAVTTPLDYGASYDQLVQINVPAVHERGFTGAGVIVCMLDTGFRKTHTAFQPIVSSGRLLAEWDFINNDGDTQNQAGDPTEQQDHGTATWSALGGAVPGSLYGPAYGASFLLGKTEDTSSETPIEEDYWVAGLEWAEARGADVVSSSLGYIDWYTQADLNGRTAVTTRAASLAAQRGVVVCTAAGNEGPTAPSLIAPADARDVLAVGAVDSNGTIASFSSRGPTADGRTKPEVCARGVSTICASAASDTALDAASGTSLATPLVGGAAALLLSAHPDWRPLDVRSALMESGNRSSSPDNTYGWGVIDTLYALNPHCYTPVPEILVCP